MNTTQLKLKFFYKRWQSSKYNPGIITNAGKNVNPYNGLIKDIEYLKDGEIRKIDGISYKRYKNSIFVSSGTQSMFSLNIYEDTYKII